MKYTLLILALIFAIYSHGQELQSPSEFLGYELGTEFTRHHRVVDYYQYIAATVPDRVQLHQYGKTYEKRPLLVAYISSASNMQQLEAIRVEHLKSTTGSSEASKAIVWLSYNVHGNESVSTEASMQTIYDLLTTKKAYLENTVVIMDPCINPDGRDRYVNWYNQHKNTPFNVDPNSKEHHEGWWSGRTNHYMFDLNRDWAWLTQVESQQRLKYYNQWMPHVHVDFHEQGVDNPYFFAPAAEPYHEVITPFQRSFQETIGKNHAKYFDANGWFYFTKEVFDLFYPSYGDTYPTYNGAIGMTYEQGGSGRAGLGIQTRIGDTLTLKDRIAHHHTTGLSTVEVASANATKLNEEFKKFYRQKNYKYNSFVMSGNKDHLDALATLLDQHEIEYGALNGSNTKGFNYNSGKVGSMNSGPNSLVVSTNQKRGTMVKVLFEPNAKLSDSLTYDITAWSLPYAYGLNTVATASIAGTTDYVKNEASSTNLDATAVAFLTDWNSMKDARFLAHLFENKIKVRASQKPFVIDGTKHNRGTLIITRSDNMANKDYINILEQASNKFKKSLIATNTAFVESGKDFGSRHVQMIPHVKVGLLSGEPTTTLQFGEIWHFFEQQLHYPLTILDSDYISRVDLDTYDVLILPDGRGYGRYINESMLKELKEWVANGGRLIAMGGAIQGIDGEKGFKIKSKEKEKDSTATEDILAYEDTQRDQMKGAITGAIFKTKVDASHPLAFGYGDTYFTLKLGNASYNYLDNGTVAYIDNTTTPVSGFAGSEAQKKIRKTLVFGVERHGRGEVVYMVDNPLFRGFWENGKLFFANALFMVN